MGNMNDFQEDVIMLKYVSQYFKINQEYWTSEPNDTINNLFNGPDFNLKRTV